MGPDDLDNLIASIRSGEGPAELDELLESIRSEGKKERGGALSLYQGTRGTDLVDEYIDERILRILNLGQVFDIDYSTYSTLLKEKLVQVNMGSSSLAREEQMLLQDEFKRVKGKVGRFKLRAKSTQISGGLGTSPIRVSKEKFYLTSNAIIPKNPSIEKVSEDMKGVQEALDKLLAEIKAENKEEKRQEEIERRNKIRAKRVAREKLLESSQKAVTSTVEKLVTPFRGILDRIFKFLYFGLLSGVVPKVIKWLADPKNKEKVDTMFRFLKDFWPAILGGLTLFFTPFGRFIKGILRTIIRFTPALAKLIKANPKIAGALAVAGAATELVRRSSNASKDILKERGKEDATPKEQADELSKPSGLAEIFTRSIVPSVSEPVEGRASGGEILGKGLSQGRVTPQTGVKIRGAGVDTQLVALQPGEFVMTKKAVDTYTPRFFAKINQSIGATNKPTFSKGIQLANNGGMVGGLQGLMPSTGGVGGLSGSSTLGGNSGGLMGSSTSMSGTGGLMGSSTSMSSIGRLMGSSTSKNKSGKLAGSSTSNSSSGKLAGSSTSKSNPGGLSGSRTSSNYSESSARIHPPLMKSAIFATSAASSGSQMRTGGPKMIHKNPKISPPQMKAPPGPPERSMRPNVTMLPEIVRGASEMVGGAAANMSVPRFSASQSNSSRDLNFAVYGIEGMT